MMILSAQGCIQLKMTLVAQLQTRGVLAEGDMHALIRPLQRVLEVLLLLFFYYTYDPAGPTLLVPDCTAGNVHLPS